MSKFNISKENIINKFKESRRYVGIAAGVLFAVGISTGAIAHYSTSVTNDVVVADNNVVSEITTTPEVTVVTTKAQTTKKVTTTTLLTTLNTTTAGRANVETPTTETTTTLSVKLVPLQAPPKIEMAEEPPITTEVTSTVTESTATETTSTTKKSDEEAATTTVAETTVEETTTTTSEPEVQKEFTVYKPSTHYVHRNTCYWYTDECYRIDSTEGLECRYCTDCNPDITIVTEYHEPAPAMTSLNYVTEEERIYLCNTVAYEYGSDWVPIYDKACVVATVMNRVRDGGWTNGLPSTVYNVLTAPYQYNPVYATPYYSYNVTQSCIDAVEYYFAHQDEFPHYTSFWGDGRYNYFR